MKAPRLQFGNSKEGFVEKPNLAATPPASTNFWAACSPAQMGPTAREYALLEDLREARETIAELVVAVRTAGDRARGDLFLKKTVASEAVLISTRDGRCTCNQADPCPIGRMASEYRCTAEELLRAGKEIRLNWENGISSVFPSTRETP